MTWYRDDSDLAPYVDRVYNTLPPCLVVLGVRFAPPWLFLSFVFTFLTGLDFDTNVILI